MKTDNTTTMYIEATRTIEDLSFFTLEFESFRIDRLTRDDLRFLRRELGEALRAARRMEKGEFPNATTLNETRDGKPKPFRGAGRTIGVDVYVFAQEDENEDTEFALALKLGRQTVNIEPLSRGDVALLWNEITGILNP